MDNDYGVSADADRATDAGALEPEVSSEAGVPNALYTHHDYGWKRHNLPDGTEESLLAALIGTHDFLEDYQGRFRVEFRRTPDYAHDGKIVVYWDSDEPKTFAFGSPLWRGDYWFSIDKFNVAPVDACRFCGGTGIDHYSIFAHCWACDGAAKQVRSGTWRGFKHKPTTDAPAKLHREYEDWLAAQAIEAGTAKTEGLGAQHESAIATKGSDAP